MRKACLYFVFLLFQLSLQAQSRTAEDYYVSAFNEMSDMISSYMVSHYSGNNYTPYVYDFETFSLDEEPWEHQFAILNVNGGFPVIFINNRGGGGLTTSISDGTYSLIFKDSSFHPNGRSVTTGHEIIGHGRSLSVGRGDQNQHVDAIQTENLILRVMGIPYINTGAEHAPNGAFPGCSLLPSFR